MSGHTRGPWHKEGPDEFGDYNIVPDSEISAIGAAVQQMLDPADPSVGAVVNNGRTPEEVAANADLFAAAPDLLAENEKLRRAVSAMVDALHEAREYFDNRADADCDQDGFIPNEEMRLLSTVDEALQHERVIAKAEQP